MSAILRANQAAPAGNRHPVSSVGIDGPGRIGLYEDAWSAAELADGQFFLETLYSGISTGTELTFFRGSNPYQHKQWDNELRAFRTAEAQPPTATQKFIGYMEVGRVTASRSSLVRPGQIIAATYAHKTGHRASENSLFFSLPDTVDPVLGIFVAQMGPICINSLAHADYFLSLGSPRAETLGSSLRGKRTAVFGAGVVGLITALLARQEQADVLVVDRDPARLARARRMGLQTLNSAEEPIRQAVKGVIWGSNEGNPGADVVVECTGSSHALNDAIAVARRQAYVLALGFYQGEASGLQLGEEFHHNGIRLICVQIGNTLPGWDHRALGNEMVRRLQDPAFQSGLCELITHYVPFSRAQQAYDALSSNHVELIKSFSVDPDSPDIMQVVLYPDVEPGIPMDPAA
ncbi:MAG: zinc-dependent alcohol dehydrogenase [Rudaea sp.]